MTDRYDPIPFGDEAEPNLRFIIPICWEKLHDESVQTVNLRDLHKWLEVATPFHKWISRRIDEYNFADGTDFWTHTCPKPLQFCPKPHLRMWEAGPVRNIVAR